MLIQSYGLFWDRLEVDWKPGPGRKRHMWGRRNRNRGTLRVADVWTQKGLYVLYSNTGPYYVGIAPRQALGTRLAEHTTDHHKNNWMRFSWFGFHPLFDDPWSVNCPDPDNKPKSVNDADVLIHDMEALLIKSMGTYNLNKMNFRAAKEWDQIPIRDAITWLAKIAPGP